MIKVGDRVATWFPGGRVVDIRPYRGRYPEYFDCVLVVTAPRTKGGTLEMAFNSKDGRDAQQA